VPWHVLSPPPVLPGQYRRWGRLRLTPGPRRFPRGGRSAILFDVVRAALTGAGFVRRRFRGVRVIGGFGVVLLAFPVPRSLGRISWTKPRFFRHQFWYSRDGERCAQPGHTP